MTSQRDVPSIGYLALQVERSSPISKSRAFRECSPKKSQDWGR